MLNKKFFKNSGIVAIGLVLINSLILTMGMETFAQQQVPSEKVTPMTPMKKPQPVITFETAYGEYFEMFPETLTIKYGTNVVNIAQGQSQTINIPEGSPLLGPGNKLPATVEYTLRNKTTKNL